MTYGFAQGADLRIGRFENRIPALPISNLQSPISSSAGVSFTIAQGGSFVPVRIDGVLGRVHAYAAGAAAAIGLIFGMNLVTISEALEDYRPAPGRTQLVPGVKHTLVIDDAYNASPLSMHAALDILRDAPAKMRKVAVLGDMLEIGKYSIEAHERAGRLAVGSANGERAVDILVAVGPRAQFIADAAREAGMKKSSVISFDTAEEAAKPVEKLLKQGDLVLVKGSHAMQLEKVVEEIREVQFATSEV
jgi:UDP-N-acetylmuramoyl-tripeptide--D-alanyl-D-alanine ligase